MCVYREISYPLDPLGLFRLMDAHNGETLPDWLTTSARRAKIAPMANPTTPDVPFSVPNVPNVPTPVDIDKFLEEDDQDEADEPGTDGSVDPSAVRVDSTRIASEAVAPDGEPSHPAEPEGEVIEASADEADEVDREGDLIGVVVPGDTDGLAFLVVRSINGSDSGRYEGNLVEEVKRRQEEAGLEPDGVVRGETWALVLREVRFPAMGQEVHILRRLLGLSDVGAFDSDVADALEAEYGDAVVTSDVWRDLLVYSQTDPDETEE